MPLRMGIIGAGAAGLMAATAADPSCEVTIIEHTHSIGKKLSATGNGKCNYTNLNMKPEYYHVREDSFVMRAIRLFGVKDTLDYFKKFGIEPGIFRDEYVYPYSEQGSSVRDTLLREVKKKEVLIVNSCTIRSISQITKFSGQKVFQILTDSESFEFDRIILATGSKAAPGSGSDGSGYGFAKFFGHKIVPVLPALCALYCKEKKFFEKAYGLRHRGEVILLSDGKRVNDEYGEIQFTDYGLSGIPIFQISRMASRLLSCGHKIEVSVDFLAGFPGMQAVGENTDDDSFELKKEAAVSYLTARRNKLKNILLGDFALGFLHERLWKALLLELGLSEQDKTDKLDEKMIKRLAKILRSHKFSVTGTAGFEKAQVCTGGVDLDEIDSSTMQSKIISGLYFAGEIMDVDGICGGYNLQWAWTSGYLAGTSASKAKGDHNR